MGLEHTEAAFGWEGLAVQRKMCLAWVFDVGWCSVRSKVCFGDGARAGRMAGRQRKMTIFFTVSFLKDQIEAPG